MLNMLQLVCLFSCFSYSLQIVEFVVIHNHKAYHDKPDVFADIHLAFCSDAYIDTYPLCVQEAVFWKLQEGVRNIDKTTSREKD